MKSATLFCSACDRQVRVMITEAPLHDGQATLHDEEVVCLEIGDRCTGKLCPLGAVEPNAMVARLVRNGIPTEGLHTVQAVCPTCGAEAEMVLYGAGRAACTVCGTSARWTLEHAEPD
ncbi:MAG TPA: hypothetical protein VJL28_04085 [Gemmatimonadaceae bacterium]|nr:hypothetical protein [Gemmatimonadaceae bacterium]